MSKRGKSQVHFTSFCCSSHFHGLTSQSGRFKQCAQGIYTCCWCCWYARRTHTHTVVKMIRCNLYNPKHGWKQATFQKHGGSFGMCSNHPGFAIPDTLVSTSRFFHIRLFPPKFTYVSFNPRGGWNYDFVAVFFHWSNGAKVSCFGYFKSQV